MQVSTRFKKRIATLFKATYDGAIIKVFSGVAPPTADDAEQGTLIGMVTLNGGFWAPDYLANGLTFALSGEFVSKPLFDSWLLTPTINETAGWWRIELFNDTGDASFDLDRVDGTISSDPASGAEMILADTALVVGTQVPIQSFLYTVPPINGV